MGGDEIAFHAHRIYGPHRLQLLLQHWRGPLDLFVQGTDDVDWDKAVNNYYNQPILVLKKRGGGGGGR